MVERRFRDLNRAVRVLTTVEKDWEGVLPQFVFGTRNITNSVTGFAPSELVYGEKIRHPINIDGNFNRFYDQATELKKTLFRLNLAEQILGDREFSLHSQSVEKAANRFEVKDYEVGQEVFIYVDEPPKGTVKRQFLPWEGPFKVTEVRPWNLVIDKYGRLVTVNKTKCIRVMPLCLPDRDLKGKAIEGSPTYRNHQETVIKAKIDYLKKKIANGESAPIGPASPGVTIIEEQKDRKGPRPKKPPHLPPARKIVYLADHFKVGDRIITYLPSKKGCYLGEITKFGSLQRKPRGIRKNG